MPFLSAHARENSGEGSPTIYKRKKRPSDKIVSQSFNLMKVLQSAKLSKNKNRQSIALLALNDIDESALVFSPIMSSEASPAITPRYTNVTLPTLGQPRPMLSKNNTLSIYEQRLLTDINSNFVP